MPVQIPQGECLWEIVSLVADRREDHYGHDCE